MGGWISISLRHNSVLALAPTNSREVVCKSIGCIRVAWCDTFSGYILAVRICSWRADIDAKSCQWIAPIFCSFSCTIVACLYALLGHLTSKVTIGTSEWAHFGESIGVNWLVSGAFQNTDSGQIVGIRINWTCFDACIRRVVSPVLFWTFLHTSTIRFISITDVSSCGYRRISCNIGTSTNTLPGGWISKEASGLAVELTNFVLVVVIGNSRTSKNALVSRVISAGVTVRIANVHTDPIVIVGKGVNTVVDTPIGPVVGIVWRNTSWVADSSVRVGIETWRASANANSFSACLVMKSVCVCMNRADVDTDSCGGISIAFRADGLTDGICCIVESECSKRAFESASVSGSVGGVECSILAYALALPCMRVTVVLCAAEWLAYLDTLF